MNSNLLLKEFNRLTKELLQIAFKHHSKSKKLFIELKTFLENNINDPNLINFCSDLISRSNFQEKMKAAKDKKKSENNTTETKTVKPRAKGFAKPVFYYLNFCKNRYKYPDWKPICQACKQEIGIDDTSGFLWKRGEVYERWHQNCYPPGNEKLFEEVRSKIMDKYIAK